MIAAEHNLMSVGQLSADLQRASKEIESTIVALGLMPPLRLGGVLYVDEPQAQAIAKHFRERK